MTRAKAALLLTAILAVPAAHAAKFGVTPLIMMLGKAKSASITVSNDDKVPSPKATLAPPPSRRPPPSSI